MADQPSRNSRREAYLQKLKDPRWQKMRLKILERDKWTCQNCGETEDTLHVHHLTYRNGAEPWDYPEDQLQTLCEGCHEEESQYRAEEEALLLEVLRGRITHNDLNLLAHAFSRLYHNPLQNTDIVSAINWVFLRNDRIVKLIELDQTDERHVIKGILEI
jgi:hypothetical protein